ncbi:retropepsin-like aspartic protease family protein [Arenibacterium halophilum]|uniref:TIGR02281 family clan AA aspartic protease n=1 Tax=Arenibacterium halophilum TaxID=2583821 RepID=A0ABY2XB21_9RHOB|nr:TIGR02281 family clan AA aspartic protease [Arenibacterium halophilum]TMV13559.1 TIGR02281 family clan AA aspartic protease [Arenibacterium halophilum]
MSSADSASLIYLLLLGAALAFWFFIQNRDSLNKKLQQAALWALIFVGAIAAYGLWDDISRSGMSARISAETGEITVPRSADGHYYLTLQVNDTPIRFVVDTGATDMVLTRADAVTAGVDPGDQGFSGRARTANGTVRVAPVRLGTVAIGPVQDRNVRASVNDGEMDTSLLGMTYLHRFSSIQITNGEMILSR